MSMKMSTSGPKSTCINNESDVYDRQIRLWGTESQSKMSSAKVLFVNISGVSSEILKNLVLAGVRATICDGRPYPETMSRTPSSFLPPVDRIYVADAVQGTKESNDEMPLVKGQKKISVAKVMQPHVHELNPLLDECDIDETVPLDSISDAYFSKFDIVVASQINIDNAVRIANAATASGGKFYLVHCFGLYGCAMVDLGSKHEFRTEMGKEKFSEVKTTNPYMTMEKIASLKLGDTKDRWYKSGPPKVYAMYRALLNYFQVKKVWPTADNSKDFVLHTRKYLKSSGVEDQDYLGVEAELEHLAAIAAVEIAPVCAVLGGILGNEIIKAISGKGDPANNILLFDAREGRCKSFTLKEK